MACLSSTLAQPYTHTARRNELPNDQDGEILRVLLVEGPPPPGRSGAPSSMSLPVRLLPLLLAPLPAPSAGLGCPALLLLLLLMPFTLALRLCWPNPSPAIVEAEPRPTAPSEPRLRADPAVPAADARTMRASKSRILMRTYSSVAASTIRTSADRIIE